MPNNDRVLVTGRGGLQGTLVDPIPSDPDRSVRIELVGSKILEVPAGLLSPQSDGTYFVPFSPDDIRAISDEERTVSESAVAPKETIIPIVAEELDVQKQAVATGRVRVHRHVMEHEEAIDMTLAREHVEIRRVLLDKDVDGPLPIRKEGDTVVVPIVEEVLVLTRRYRLKEEVRITKTVRQEQYRDRVVLRSQEAEIEELDPSQIRTAQKG